MAFVGVARGDATADRVDAKAFAHLAGDAILLIRGALRGKKK